MQFNNHINTSINGIIFFGIKSFCHIAAIKIFVPNIVPAMCMLSLLFLLHFQDHPIQFFVVVELTIITFAVIPCSIVWVPDVDVIAAIVVRHADALAIWQFFWRIVPLIIYFHCCSSIFILLYHYTIVFSISVPIC